MHPFIASVQCRAEEPSRERLKPVGRLLLKNLSNSLVGKVGAHLRMCPRLADPPADRFVTFCE
jgi:hypothetical protein